MAGQRTKTCIKLDPKATEMVGESTCGSRPPTRTVTGRWSNHRPHCAVANRRFNHQPPRTIEHSHQPSSRESARFQTIAPPARARRTHFLETCKRFTVRVCLGLTVAGSWPRRRHLPPPLAAAACRRPSAITRRSVHDGLAWPLITVVN